MESSIPWWFEICDRKYTGELLRVMDSQLFIWKGIDKWRLDVIGYYKVLPARVTIKRILQAFAEKQFKFDGKIRKIERVQKRGKNYYRMVPLGGSKNMLVLIVGRKEISVREYNEQEASKMVDILLDLANENDARSVELQMHTDEGPEQIIYSQLSRVYSVLRNLLLVCRTKEEAKELLKKKILKALQEQSRVIFPKHRSQVLKQFADIIG